MPSDVQTAMPATTDWPLPGIDGFLGTRASLGMDVVLVGLIALLPVLAWSIRAAQARRFILHKRLQLTIAVLLLAAIVFFEVDIRLVSDWKARADASPWWPGTVLAALGIHLVFATTTLVLWVWVLWEALGRFPNPPSPGRHGPRHRTMARVAALDLVLTALTGFVFYWLAFVA
jgi:putative membrane protein